MCWKDIVPKGISARVIYSNDYLACNKKLYTLIGREGEMKSFMKIFIRNNLGGRKKIHMINKRIVLLDTTINIIVHHERTLSFLFLLSGFFFM